MALHAVYSLCQHLSKSPELRQMNPHPRRATPTLQIPGKNVSRSLFWRRARTRERGLVGAPWLFPSPPSSGPPSFSSGFGSRDHTESPAHLDTRDWLSHGDLREAQSWARPRVSTHRENRRGTGHQLGAVHLGSYSKLLGDKWSQEISVTMSKALGNWAWDGQETWGSCAVTRDAARTQKRCSRSAGRTGPHGPTLPWLCEGVESRSPAPAAYSARRNA